MKVVCIDDDWGESPLPAHHPIKGEIYHVTETYKGDNGEYFILKECYRFDYWWTYNFRPADDTFGPAVCERLEEQVLFEEFA